MRKIKFRGMDLLGEWHTGLICIEGKNTYICNSEGSPRAFEIRPETIGQYLWLKDKNGKEIYEGDIFNCIYSNHCDCKRVITWNEQRGCFFPMRDRDCKQSGVTQTMRDMSRYNIIGNIYENSELLETNK